MKAICDRAHGTGSIVISVSCNGTVAHHPPVPRQGDWILGTDTATNVAARSTRRVTQSG